MSSTPSYRNSFASTDTMHSATGTSHTTVSNSIHVSPPFVHTHQPFSSRFPIHMQNKHDRIVSNHQNQRTFHMGNTEAFYPFRYQNGQSLQQPFQIAHQIAQMQTNSSDGNNAPIQKTAPVVHSTPIAHGMISRTVTPTEHDAHDSTRFRISSPLDRTIHVSTPTSLSMECPSHVIQNAPGAFRNSVVFHEMGNDGDICHGAAALIGLANTPISSDDVKSIESMKVHNGSNMICGSMNEQSHPTRFVPSFRPSKDDKVVEFIHGGYPSQSSHSSNDFDFFKPVSSSSDMECSTGHDTTSSEDDQVEEWHPSNTRTRATNRVGNTRSRLQSYHRENTFSRSSSVLSQHHSNAKRRVRSSAKKRSNVKHHMLKPKRPNPNTTEIYCSKNMESQKPSKEISLRPNQGVSDFPTKLALEQDDKMVNLLHCYVRSNLLEIVVCDKSDPSKKLYPGRVGLRCVYCKNAGEDASRTSVVYPRSLALLYRAVCGWQRTHVTGDKANMPCENIPKDVMDHYDYCKEVDKTRGRVAYWEQSARMIGLIDSSGTGVRCEGIVFAKNDCI